MSLKRMSKMTPTEKLNNKIKKLVAGMNATKYEREEKLKERVELKSEWDQNKEDILAIENNIELIKQKVEFIEGMLTKYYINLLKQGTDTR